MSTTAAADFTALVARYGSCAAALRSPNAAWALAGALALLPAMDADRLLAAAAAELMPDPASLALAESAQGPTDRMYWRLDAVIRAHTQRCQETGGAWTIQDDECVARSWSEARAAMAAQMADLLA